jgi:hypothetical protein
MRKLGMVAAATLALLGTTAYAKTTIVYAGRVITDASKPAQGPSTVTITDDRITSITPAAPKRPPAPKSLTSATRRCCPA